ncbi:hypothetical protein DFH07DRAFT_943484 [Mycena maculata]|uniref:Uncharacterized protein n=1 Tax=Mycena maculata TaxID=230809 RepID=A0AAD7IFB3_9AGAR|nr:hypothetical protein DFH07DRAFT_943484 [Mycena maculata]
MPMMPTSRYLSLCPNSRFQLAPLRRRLETPSERVATPSSESIRRPDCLGRRSPPPSCACLLFSLASRTALDYVSEC